MKAALLILIALLASRTFADGDGGVIGSSGQYAYETGVKGAALNHELTNQLYQSSLNNESSAWSTFPPNVRTLAKAFSLGRDANKTDQQTIEFSKAALNGLNSATQAGNFNADDYGIGNQADLQDWATNRNPIVQVAKSRFDKYEKYGLSLGPDGKTLKTPIGDLDLTGNIAGGTLGSLAKVFGYDPADVAAGIQDGINERNRIVAAVSAKIDAELAQKQAQQKAAAPGAGTNKPASEAAPDPANRDPANALNAGPAELNDSGGVDENDTLEQRQKDLLAHMELIRKQLGGNGLHDPIGQSNQNLFTMVHDRYQLVRHDGRLFEGALPTENSTH